VGLREAITVCGERSAHDPKVDKFELAGLTPGSSVVVKPPIIQECPVNLECIVRHRIPLGSHDVFVGEVVASHMYGRPVKTDVTEENVWVLQPEDGGPRMKLYWKTLMDFSPAE